MVLELGEWHTTRKVPIFLKSQSIIKSSDDYSLEEMISVDEELQKYSRQIDELRNMVYALACEKWAKQIMNNIRK